MLSGKTTKRNIPIYTDSDVIHDKSDFNVAMEKIDNEIADASSAVNSVNGKTGVVVITADDLDAVEKEDGKGLSTNDFTDTYKTMVDTHDTEIGELQSDKQDKEAGKGLSTNDFTDGYKIQISDNTNRLNDHDGLIQGLEDEKQDKLTAGTGINIDTNNEISVGIDNDSIILDSQGHLSAPGGIPIQLSVMPEPTTPEEIAQWLGKIRQYIGATTGTYKNGYYYIYELNAVTGIYKWTEKQVQVGGAGGGGVQTVNDKLPDEEGNVQLIPNDIGAYSKSEINDFLNPINETLLSHEQELERLDNDKASSKIFNSSSQQTVDGKLVPVLTEQQIRQIMVEYKKGSVVIIKDTVDNKFYSVIDASENIDASTSTDIQKITLQIDKDFVIEYVRDTTIVSTQYRNLNNIDSDISTLQDDITQAQTDITQAQTDITTLQDDLQDEIDDRVAGDEALASRVQAIENTLPTKQDHVVDGVWKELAIDGTGKLFYTKINDIVYIMTGGDGIKPRVNTSGAEIATIPAGYRPAGGIYAGLPVWCSTPNYTGLIWIHDDGKIYHYFTGANPTYPLYGNNCYPASLT